MLANENSEAIAAAREALPIVERLGLTPQRARLLDVIGISRTLQGDVGGLADSKLAIEVARESGALYELMVATNNLHEGQMFLGRIDEAAATYDAFRVLVTRFGTVNNRRWLAFDDAQTCYVEGRWDEALARLDEEIARCERGFPFYLEALGRTVRARIRDGRGDSSGALAESERALDLASKTKDPQQLAPVLVLRARLLVGQARTEEANRLVSEVLEMVDVAVPGLSTTCRGEPLITLSWLARDLGRADEVGAALTLAVRTPWIAAAMEVLERNATAAADALSRLRGLPAEAYTRLRAGRDLIAGGRPEEGSIQLRGALEYHRGAGAIGLVREAEALLGASATPAS